MEDTIFTILLIIMLGVLVGMAAYQIIKHYKARDFKEKIISYHLDLIVCLKAYSVEKLSEFVESHKNIIDNSFVKEYKNADEKVKELTLNRLVIMTSGVDPRIKEKVIKWFGEKQNAESKS